MGRHRRGPKRDPEGAGGPGASLGTWVAGDKSEVKLGKGRVTGLGDLPFPAVGFRLPGIAQIPPILPATSEEAQGQASGGGSGDLRRP